MSLPYLVVSDEQGNIFEIPDLLMTGMRLNTPLCPDPEEIIPLPNGSDLFHLPGHAAVGYRPRDNRYITVTSYQGIPVHAVAAFLAPAYLQLYRNSSVKKSSAPRLPLYSYSPIGWQEDRFFSAAKRIDPDKRQDLELMDEERINKNACGILERFPKNRLAAHLVNNCVFRYCCPAARNFVMGRWECPVPLSPVCNARCVGCISQQPKNSKIPVSQERIGFVPTVEEITELTVPHLEKAPRPVISFGQGCEGEPLLAADTIKESIKVIRKKTKRGI